ncbi:MAG: type I methionyl aminopeptidase [Candidatus Liptonbacteria bacterium]|nr:type I methionyl aminopeptidase [Candidatus Liptonbacteria bacterium]
MVLLKNKKEIDGIRKSGRILSLVLKKLRKAAKIGVSLIELDKLAAEIIKSKKAESAFLYYRPLGSRYGFPGHICLSLNETVVHGIPDDYVLKDRDLLKIDVGIKYKGLISDAATTLIIGSASSDVCRLIKATKQALTAGIKVLKIGNQLGDVGAAIEKVARKNRVNVIRGLGGHGVGFYPHEEPMVYNFGEKGKGMTLVEGMVIALEPMFSLGSSIILELDDGSFITSDRSLSAHFEHTIAVTKSGPKVLTL